MSSLSDAIINWSDIVSYISKHVQLKKSWTNFSWLCPFHNEKSPSFVVSPQKQLFKCFWCGIGGSIISFAMEYEKMDYLDAVKSLGSEFHIDIQPLLLSKKNNTDTTPSTNKEQLKLLLKKTQEYFTQQLSKQSIALSYLQHKRQLSGDIINQFWLWYAPDSYEELIDLMIKQGFTIDQLESVWLAKKNERGSAFSFFRKRITIPVYDAHGSIVWFGARALDPEDNPKYLNSPDTILYDKSTILYGLNRAKNHLKHHKKIIIVEWYLDVIGAHRCGLPVAVATCGTALTDQHIKLLKRYTENIHLLFDNDEAGRQATIKAIKNAYHQNIYPQIITLPSPYKDIDDVANDASLTSEQRLELLNQSQDSKQRLHTYISATFDLTSPVDKTKALWLFRDILAQIQNHVILDQLLHDATTVFWTQYEVLLSEFKKHLKQQPHYLRTKKKQDLSTSPQSSVSKEHLVASLWYEDYINHHVSAEYIAKRILITTLITQALPDSIIGHTLEQTLTPEQIKELPSYHIRRDQQRDTNTTIEDKQTIIHRIISPVIKEYVQHILKNPSTWDDIKQEIIQQRNNSH